MPSARLVAVAAAALAVAAAFAIEPAPAELPDGPTWGRGPFQPHAANSVFATADGCSLCHSLGPNAKAMRLPNDGDASPWGSWRASMMANAFRDPYWRAKVVEETSAHPHDAAEIEALCLTCHGPMAHHTARLSGAAPPRVADAAHDALAADGVSCTVCHQAQPETLGTPASFSGNLDIRPGRTIFGPYEAPFANPMRNMAVFTPTHGPHISEAALCGSCHTLFTTHAKGAEPFPEQTPYLEWRNSDFSTESDLAATPAACRTCHMPNVGSTRIARNPRGFDFGIAPRDGVRAHAIVGGNALMLDIFAAAGDELGSDVPSALYAAMAEATRAQLRERTADLAVAAPRTEGDRLAYDVTVRNRTGHKLPTGYPSRRLWIHFVAVQDGRTIFESGAFDADGRILGEGELGSVPHRDVIASPDEVQIWEHVPHDASGRPTTMLTAMAARGKDNRLLPRGWHPQGPHVDATAPLGTERDDDFVGGSDVVTYLVPARPDGGPVTVIATLHFQSIPPAWAAPLRRLPRGEAERFIRLYDDADTKVETVATATR